MLRALRRRRGTVLAGGGGAAAIDWVNSSPSAITPTLGSELIVNGDFSAWTADNPDGWTVSGESAPDPEVSEVGTGEGHGGVGTGMCNFYATGSNALLIKQLVAVPGELHQYSINVDGNYSTWGLNNYVGSKSWSGLRTAGVRTWRGLADNVNVQLVRELNPMDITIDDVSLKQLNGSVVNEESTIVSNGYGYAHWNIDTLNAAGFDMYANANGILRVIVQRYANPSLPTGLWFGSYNGTWTWLFNEITYSDLKAVWMYVDPTNDTVMVGYDTPADIESWAGDKTTFDAHDIRKVTNILDTYLDSLTTLRLVSSSGSNTPQEVRFKENPS